MDTFALYLGGLERTATARSFRVLPRSGRADLTASKHMVSTRQTNAACYRTIITPSRLAIVQATESWHENHRFLRTLRALVFSNHLTLSQTSAISSLDRIISAGGLFSTSRPATFELSSFADMFKGAGCTNILSGLTAPNTRQTSFDPIAAICLPDVIIPYRRTFSTRSLFPSWSLGFRG